MMPASISQKHYPPINLRAEAKRVLSEWSVLNTAVFLYPEMSRDDLRNMICNPYWQECQMTDVTG